MKKGKIAKFGIIMLLFIAAVFFIAGTGKKAEAAQKQLASITAVYTGETLLIGHSMDLEKLTVMGLYTDGS